MQAACALVVTKVVRGAAAKLLCMCHGSQPPLFGHDLGIEPVCEEWAWMAPATRAAYEGTSGRWRRQELWRGVPSALPHPASTCRCGQKHSRTDAHPMSHIDGAVGFSKRTTPKARGHHQHPPTRAGAGRQTHRQHGHLTPHGCTLRRPRLLWTASYDHVTPPPPSVWLGREDLHRTHTHREHTHTHTHEPRATQQSTDPVLSLRRTHNRSTYGCCGRRSHAQFFRQSACAHGTHMNISHLE